MSFAIKHGLFKLNLTDYHAILGISLDADPKQIRLSYLKIAQKLHPDKCRKDPQRMQIAGQLLSKLVNPAYEQLSRKSNYAEHQLVLTQIGRRLAENKNKVVVTTQAARELLETNGSAELVYTKLLKKIAAEQYKSLENIEKNIGAISELNLVYLMLKCDRVAEEGQKPQASRPSANMPPKPAPKRAPKSAPKAKDSRDRSTINQSKKTIDQAKATSHQKSSKIEEPTPGDRVNAFVGRAQQYIAKEEFDLAITELRDALRIDPNHAVAHAVMGQTYLHKKQLTMAKVHIDRAHKAEPQNTIVLESKKALDKSIKKSEKGKTSSSTSSNKPGNSGFFSGFFGAKKK